MTGTMSPTLPTGPELGEIVGQVWSSFLGGEVVALERMEAETSADQMVASVSISGDWCGHVMVVVGRSCAYGIASRMFHMPAGDLCVAEVADALGEIANMVGGSVKGMVGVPAMLSLPQVVLDASALVNPDARKVIGIVAMWNGQPVEVSLWERHVDVRTAVEGV